MSDAQALDTLLTSPDWRQMPMDERDLTSAQRTPMQRLRPVPEAARRSFAPFIETVPGVRIGENDLTRLAPGRPQAQGDVIEVSGRIVDRDGRPLRNLLVEMWGANKWGRYTHKDDPGREPLDPNFLGHGRTLTDGEGRYRFRTIRPAPYLVRPDVMRWRPAHLHFSLRGGGARLVTQMYFAHDPYLEIDPGFNLLGEAKMRHLVPEIPAAEEGVTSTMGFDIVIGGRSATMFES